MASDIFEDSNSISRIKTLLASTLQSLIKVFKAQSGSLFLYNAPTNELVLSAYYNAKGFVLTDIRKHVGEGVAGCVIKMRQPILVRDIDSDARFNRNGYAHYRGKSFISIPLVFADQLIGLINVTDKESAEPFTEQDLNFANKELKALLERLLDQGAFVKENKQLKAQLEHIPGARFLNITGCNPKMRKIYSLIEAVANTRATVLIHGESGTGKRLIAHAIHNFDPNESKKPFIEVSCGALTETLLDSELFGHVKGAFTGAIKERRGRFELAHNGTIFLDEIDSFTLSMQAKLLRVLQDGEFERVGDSKTIKVDIRIIAATNQSLPDLIAQGKFRKDLFYRLNIINIEVPPLRERVSDIALLAQDLIEKHAKQLGKAVHTVSDEALDRFKMYHWPGNIRELENVIERAAILTKGQTVCLQDLPDFLSNVEPEESAGVGGSADAGAIRDQFRSAMKDSEQVLIQQALDQAKGNRSLAAKNLGIDRTTLYKKMVALGMHTAKKNISKMV